MCGRFAMNAEVDELIQAYVAQGGKAEDWATDAEWRSKESDASAWAKDWRPTFSIRPTDQVPVVVEREPGAVTIEPMMWDWWPKPKDVPVGKPIINATIEKLTQGYWGPAFLHTRAIVPMTGYYEWTGKPGDMQPHYLHGNGLLHAAALYTDIELPSGEVQHRVVVITRDGVDAAGQIHKRMPAFLTPDLLDTWLDPELLIKSPQPSSARAHLQEALVDISDQVGRTITTYPVAKRLTKAVQDTNYDRTLIDPVTVDEGMLGAETPTLF